MTEHERKEAILEQFNTELKVIIGEYMHKQKEVPGGLEIYVEVVQKDRRTRKDIYLDKDYSPIHKSFLIDSMVENMTLCALVGMCKEMQIDFRKYTAVVSPNSEDGGLGAFDVVNTYDDILDYLTSSMKYTSKGLSHKDFTTAIFKRVNDREAAQKLINHIKASSGAFCTSEECDALRNRIKEDTKEEDKGGEND